MVDKQMMIDVVRKMGGYVCSVTGGISVCGLSPRDQDIFDIIADDFDQLMLADRIEKGLGDRKITDEALKSLLEGSKFWFRVQLSPTSDSNDDDLTLKISEMINDALSDHLDHQRAVMLYGLESGWELWVMISSDTG